MFYHDGCFDATTSHTKALERRGREEMPKWRSLESEHHKRRNCLKSKIELKMTFAFVSVRVRNTVKTREQTRQRSGKPRARTAGTRAGRQARARKVQRSKSFNMSHLLRKCRRGERNETRIRQFGYPPQRLHLRTSVSQPTSPPWRSHRRRLTR